MFVLGLFIGGIIGAIVIAAVASGKAPITDRYQEGIERGRLMAQAEATFLRSQAGKRASQTRKNRQLTSGASE